MKDSAIANNIADNLQQGSHLLIFDAKNQGVFAVLEIAKDHMRQKDIVSFTITESGIKTAISKHHEGLSAGKQVVEREGKDTVFVRLRTAINQLKESPFVKIITTSGDMTTILIIAERKSQGHVKESKTGCEIRYLNWPLVMVGFVVDRMAKKAVGHCYGLRFSMWITLSRSRAVDQTTWTIYNYYAQGVICNGTTN